MKFLKAAGTRNNIKHRKQSEQLPAENQENIKPIEDIDIPRQSLQNNQKINRCIQFSQKISQEEINNDPTSYYHQDIITYLVTLPKFGPFPYRDYFSLQEDIKEDMRITLFNWIIDVHLKYKLKPQTLFVTFNIIDQYLSVKSIHRSQLQLLGITAIWIASKYEQTYQVPTIKNLVFICDSCYTKQEILSMETKIFLECQFNILQPTILQYFQFININFQLTKLEYNLGRYLLELILFDIKFRKYSPNMISFAVFYFLEKLDSQHLSKKGWNINTILQQYQLNINQKQLKVIARQICLLWQKSLINNSYHRLKHKYAASIYHSISSISIEQYTKQCR